MHKDYMHTAGNVMHLPLVVMDEAEIDPTLRFKTRRLPRYGRVPADTTNLENRSEHGPLPLIDRVGKCTHVVNHQCSYHVSSHLASRSLPSLWPYQPYSLRGTNKKSFSGTYHVEKKETNRLGI